MGRRSSGSFSAAGPGATNHFEAGGFVRSNDAEAYPNLMFHFLPIAVRYDGSAPASDHGYQVHIGPMYSDARGIVKIKSPDPRVHPALRFNYLSTDQDRREWVEAIRVARGILDPARVRSLQRRRIVARARRSTTDEQILEWVPRMPRRRCTPRAPRGWASTTLSVIDPLSMAVHGVRGPPRRRCLGHAVRDERQHLRAGDDGRGEGRRPDPGNTPLPPEDAAFFRRERSSTCPSPGARRSRTSWSWTISPAPPPSTAASSAPWWTASTGTSSSVLRLLDTWLLLVTGGPPTRDKPTVTFATPNEPDRVSHSMTFRVSDLPEHVRSAHVRGAREFLTPPVESDWEIRAFFRDPDGHLLEISQTIVTACLRRGRGADSPATTNPMPAY